MGRQDQEPEARRQQVSPSRGDLQLQCSRSISSLSWPPVSSSLAFHHQKYFCDVTQPTKCRPAQLVGCGSLYLARARPWPRCSARFGSSNPARAPRGEYRRADQSRRTRHCPALRLARLLHRGNDLDVQSAPRSFAAAGRAGR